MVRTQSRLAVRVVVTRRSTSMPWRFSISAWPHVTEASFLAWPLATQPRIGIGCALLGRIRARVAVESTQRLLGLPPSGRFGGGGLFLGRKLLRLAAASIKVPSTLKCSALNRCSPRAVLGKRAVIAAGLKQIHIRQPAKQKVVGQLIAEGPLAANGVQAHQPAGFEQPFGRHGGTTLAVGDVDLIEQGRKLQQ